MIDAPQWGYSSVQLWARLPQGRLIEGLIEPSKIGTKPWARRVDRWVCALNLAIDRGGITSRELRPMLDLPSKQAASLLQNMASAGMLRRTRDLRRGAGHRQFCRVYAPTDEGKKYVETAA